MPGFLGLRGHTPKNPYDRERERREENRQTGLSSEQERRSKEKVQEILNDQKGDMSAYTGTLNNAGMSDCDQIAAMPVGEIMSAKVAALSFDDNLLTVQGIFSSVRFRHLPVVNELGCIIGIISDRDFLRVVSPFFGTINEQTRDKEIMARRVGTIMTRKPICAYTDTSILDAVKLMNGRKISCLPIVEEGSMLLLGIVTWKDIVRAFCAKAFNPAKESARLRSGVRINPETSESARLRARSQHSTRMAKAVPDHARTPQTKQPENRGGEESDTRDSTTMSGRHSSRDRRTDTAHILRHSGPHIAASEKLRDGYTAGQAGSDLAAKQKALIREQIENRRDRSHETEE